MARPKKETVQEEVIQAPVEAVVEITPQVEAVQETVVEAPVEEVVVKTETKGLKTELRTITLEESQDPENRKIGIRSPGVWKVTQLGDRVRVEHLSC